jgi:hypothetical protein
VEGDEARYVRVDDLDTAGIAYFGSSVFWRSHVADTRGSGNVNLGVKYGEQFRRYLVDQAEFPEHSVISMAVLDPRRERRDYFSLWLTSPMCAQSHGIHRYNFIICGLLFELYVGRALPPSLRSLCLARSGAKVALLLPPNRIGLLKTAAPLALKTPWRGKPL